MSIEYYIALIKAGNHIVVMVNRSDNAIQAFHTEQEGIDHFEGMYNINHARDYTSSMSALINNISFRPSIVGVESLDEVINNILSDPPKLLKLQNVSGRMMGISTRECAEDYWEKGAKPQMISRDANGTLKCSEKIHGSQSK